jgi:hypothetical protein
MTTEPLKEPFNVRAAFYQGDRHLADVLCKLSPPDAPVIGMALVTSEVDWLHVGPLTLALRSGPRYQILPAKLEGAAEGKSLFRFYIRP